MIRFLLALAAIYFIYWLVTKDSKSKAKAKQRKRPSTSSASSDSNIILDEMKRCPTCDTFNPKSYAYPLKGEYYCDAQCAQKRRSSS